MPPYANMVMTSEPQNAEDRRTCHVCHQTKALSEFSLKNGRPRRVCKLCRITRTVRQREEDHRKRTERCFLALGREIRRGRGNHARAAELLDQLQLLCGGNLKMVAEQWGEFLAETAEKRPGTSRALKGLITVAEVLWLAQQADRDNVASQAAGRKHKAGPARASGESPDFSAWTDKQLEEAIEQYERGTDQER